MNITKKQENDTLEIAVEGRIDTTTAPKLGEEIQNIGDDVQKLVLNLEKLDYISSAGLRIILSAQKTFSAKGGMKIINVNDIVKEIFEVTGFTDILDIE